MMFSHMVLMSFLSHFVNLTCVVGVVAMNKILTGTSLVVINNISYLNNWGLYWTAVWATPVPKLMSLQPLSLQPRNSYQIR